MTSNAPEPDLRSLQRRTVSTLVTSQMLGGVGVASGIAVMALLALQISGSEQASGLGTTMQVLGSAVITIPVTRVMARSGRRPGLLLGYGLAVVGCVLIIVSAQVNVFPLMLLGSLLFGAATTANNQSRYAGADLAEPKHHGRDLSLVVWATTVGSVVGPNLVGASEPIARALGMPKLSGTFIFSLIGFALAAVVIGWRLRPDPLLVARATAADKHSDAQHSLLDGYAAVRGHPRALLGLLTMSLGHAVMISVMVMTPLHMDHGGASLQLVGFVISIHILGMYAFSPVTGWLVDRFGGPVVAVGGSALLVAGCLLAARTHEGISVLLTVALFTIGLGWSATLVSGSTMLTGALAVRERAAGQGVSDLVMGLAGASCGAVSGVVLDRFSYAALAYGGVVLAALITVAVCALSRR